MLRDRGSVSELSIEGQLVIEQDNPNEDAMLQSISEVIQVSKLPIAAQEAIQAVFDLCQVRLAREHGVSSA